MLLDRKITAAVQSTGDLVAQETEVTNDILGDQDSSQSAVNYFTSISFCVEIFPSYSALSKYMPLGVFDASKVRLYVPASI